ncbi:hypothetical protein G6F59_014556 [Rhizopus arrhizus]|nr:hypothetical protein G6F59_014556 [Rhizopus arrhizus]
MPRYSGSSPLQECPHVVVLRSAGRGPLCRGPVAPGAGLPRPAADESPAAGRTGPRAGARAGAGRRWRPGAESLCRGTTGLAAAGRGPGRTDAGPGRADAGPVERTR